MVTYRVTTVLLLCTLPASLVAQPATNLAAWQDIARILQSPAVAMPGYVRFNLPRSDLTVTMQGIPLSPSIVQGGWVGFAGNPGTATVLGDLVLLPTELTSVTAGLQARGFEVSAIHNHLMGESPGLVYVHLAATGSGSVRAAQLDSVLRLTNLPRPVQALPPAGTIDSAAVFGGLGVPGRVRGAVAQTSPILFSDSVRWAGQVLPPALVANSPINLQAVGSERLVGSGDFALLSRQVAPVLAALAQNDILTTAVHSHLVSEQPRITYVHFWANGPTAAVLTGLRAALDAARTALP